VLALLALHRRARIGDALGETNHDNAQPTRGTSPTTQRNRRLQDVSRRAGSGAQIHAPNLQPEPPPPRLPVGVSRLNAACELLRLWRQATVIVVGCLFIFVVLAHSVDLLSTHRFRILLFTVSPSNCPFGIPCERPSGTERFAEYSVVHLLRSEVLLYGTFPAFQLSCSPELLKKLAYLFFPVLNSTF
jgi:hypothetical protein